MDTRSFSYFKLAICALLAIAVQAYGDNLNVSISPPNPTSHDVIMLTASGMWGDTCVPNGSFISVFGNNISFNIYANYPPNFACAEIVVGWQQTNFVGPLAPGVYTIQTQVVGYWWLTQTTHFTVSGPTERHVPSQYATIQAAINASSNGDVVIVAPGTYTGDGNRDVNFLGKAITVRSTDPNDPSIVAATIIDCQNTNHRGFEFINNEGRTTILEGLTITDANIVVSCEGGGGIYIRGASPTINNCVVANNHVELGMTWCYCLGGGIFIGSGSNPLIINCVINGNSVGNWGWGGGIYCDYSALATISNCLITNNNALGIEGMAGGIYNYGSGSLTIINCTIANNSATNDGGGVYGPATIKDSIIWANTGINQIYGVTNITYSDIQGGFANTGNINADPYFVTGPLGDYYLSQTAAGQTSDSPCVNTGSDNAENLNMNLLTTRTDGVPDTGVVNMGYHYPTSIVILSSDLDRNFFVDFLDYALMSRNWQLSPDPFDTQSGDIIKDGIVNIYDLAKFCSDWLACFVTNAAAPQPADHAMHVSRNVILQWSPGDNVASHDVYFGTDFNAVDTADTANSGVYIGNQTVNHWNNANELDTNTIYYWRIDERGPACAAKGSVWSFTTLSAGEVDEANLVAWWKFDETNGTTAYDSAGSNNGTLYGNPQWVAGKIGGALDGDGNGDYVRVPDNASLTPSNAITIAFWLYNRDGTAGIYKYADCPDQTGKGSPGNSRAYAFSVNSAGASLLVCQTRDAMDYISSIGTVSLNQWHHLAATFDHGQAFMYIDGQLDNTKTLSVTSIMNDAQPLIIGGFWEYCTPSFYNRLNGRIDDVRIYNRALTADEIALLYQPTP